MYEGAPNFPGEDRFWDIVERHKVTQFYTAPTAIRAFMKWGDEHPPKHDLSSLEVLGTVGEPINPEAWMWYHRVIGGERCPIVDTWWQTETGGHMITPLPGATPTKPGSCTLPFFGIDAAIVNERGRGAAAEHGRPAGRSASPGRRCCAASTATGSASSRRTGRRIPGMYFAGDGARRDERGYFWIMGRVDDVINVSGHRLGTMEVESCAGRATRRSSRPRSSGMPHEIKGTGIAAFVHARAAHQPADRRPRRRSRRALREHVATEIGAIAKPDVIRFTDALPKTRSGKIMRRLLRDIAAGDGDHAGHDDARGLLGARQTARERRRIAVADASALGLHPDRRRSVGGGAVLLQRDASAGTQILEHLAHPALGKIEHLTDLRRRELIRVEQHQQIPLGSAQCLDKR